jgi:hypothetical protein
LVGVFGFSLENKLQKVGCGNDFDVDRHIPTNQGNL